MAAAIIEKPMRLEREQLEKELIGGCAGRLEEAVTINVEWEVATLEKWPGQAALLLDRVSA